MKFLTQATDDPAIKELWEEGKLSDATAHSRKQFLDAQMEKFMSETKEKADAFKSKLEAVVRARGFLDGEKNPVLHLTEHGQVFLVYNSCGCKQCLISRGEIII